MSALQDPYEVLGVPRSASTHEIRAAYVAQARRAHPDLNGGRGVDVMRRLNEAWEILKDATRRQAWDAAHHGRGNGGPVFSTRPDGKPFWTGAMGPAPGRPAGTVLDFGIYDGWSLGEIARRDRGYLVWLRDRPEAEAFVAEITRLLDPMTEDHQEARRPKRRWYPSR